MKTFILYALVFISFIGYNKLLAQIIDPCINSTPENYIPFQEESQFFPI
jgi:hypothetical protein